MKPEAVRMSKTMISEQQQQGDILGGKNSHPSNGGSESSPPGQQKLTVTNSYSKKMEKNGTNAEKLSSDSTGYCGDGQQGSQRQFESSEDVRTILKKLNF
jgi:hypothetical protein